GCDDVPSSDWSNNLNAPYTHIAYCAYSDISGTAPGSCRYKAPEVQGSSSSSSNSGGLCPETPDGWEDLVSVATSCTTRNDCHYPGCNDYWDSSNGYSPRPAECVEGVCTHAWQEDRVVQCDAPPADFTPRTDFMCNRDADCVYDGCKPLDSGSGEDSFYCRSYGFDPTFQCVKYSQQAGSSSLCPDPPGWGPAKETECSK
ncbi:hypothetical protein T484DRAFT_1800526, partial [Baffinella frigidus]